MITPTRFGLKYAPVPTLALEYEDDLKSVDDSSGASLYVYKGSDAHPQQRQRKKLHIVELPTLTKHSETMQIVKQLQQDNRRFLAPEIVKEDQLKRLLERLVAHLQATELKVSETSHVSGGVSSVQQESADDDHGDDNDDEEEEEGEEGEDGSELEESAMEESVAEVSMSMDASKAESDATEKAQETEKSIFGDITALNADDLRGRFGAHTEDEETNVSPPKQLEAESDNEEEQSQRLESPEKREKEEDDEQDDAAKKKAVKSESDVSDEDVESEELEYFSEDASDEDSF